MAPINSLMYLFSAVPNKPYLSLSQFPNLIPLRENWQLIKEEALTLESKELIKGSNKYNDIGFNSFFRRGWKRFYLKWYDDFHPSAKEHCPKTIEMIKEIPSIKAAMFVVLPAGSKLPEHRDPYAGSLRYHLGLITPNSEDCRIVVDGKPYFWKDGEDVLFDETYVHYAINETEKDRLIFFCDVQRPMSLKVGEYLNKFFSWFIMSAAASPNMENDRTGALNKIFRYLYQIRLVGKRLKAFNKPLYYVVKYILFLGIIYLIFF
ncbi:aspartyl/asparaginyl beta-hydroxylase domain-containing protein [Fulvivirgaceae bacterium BMA10]|uniref:Aspartyl/asparaginyl beta-hydroxylase domain-containing protein n=1 Tax=Splendidivirga corallicola TaxID=3051826 RepID=A0ABT8KG97_9BACT|nr:aspartyl/asparaginyl beta-hydroxylase domain-containing protein [Fulvivirgaceae bacterium BMA10]